MDPDLPTQGLQQRWDDVEEDLRATAAELDADGWSTVTLHPADVTSRPDADPPGLDVMVPSNEFDDLEAELKAGATFADSAVFRSAAGGVAFLLCVLRDPDRRVAALVPAFYPQEGTGAQALAVHAADAGVVHLHIHPLRRDRVVTFSIDDPALVFPADWRE
jgi:hypothetical protein